MKDDKITRISKYLKDEFNISNETELKKELAKMPKLNIGIFVSPVKVEG